jgi:hypothetical protein
VAQVFDDLKSVRLGLEVGCLMPETCRECRVPVRPAAPCGEAQAPGDTGAMLVSEGLSETLRDPKQTEHVASSRVAVAAGEQLAVWGTR